MPMNPRTLRPGSTFTPRSISGLALWLDAADTSSLYTTDAGPVTPVSAPTEISGCALWLDGADSSAASMLLNGSLVETWKDKSGNGRDFTATGTARPTLTATAINSRSAVTFNGSTNTLTGNTATQDVIRNLAGYTVFAVLRTASIAAGERLAFGVGATVMFRTGQTDSRSFIGGRRVAADTLESVMGAASDLSVGTTFIQTAAVNHAAQSLTGLRNGAAFGLDTTYMAAGVSENVASSVSVGTQAGGTYGFWNGEIAEIVVFNTALSTTDRARVEAYLAAKWGISGVHAQAAATNDPVGHWRNKAGAGAFTQSTASLRPVRNLSFQNSKPAVVGDGVDDWLSAAASSIGLSSVTAATGFFVYRSTGGTSAWDFGISASGNPTVAGLVYDDFFRSVRTPGSFTAPSIGVTAVTSPASGGRSYRINGAAMSFADSGAFATPTTAYVGGGPTFPSGFTSFGGGVCESLVYGKVLSASEIARIERYLAAKWGIALALQVSNADAQDWVNRVYANGGTVSATTASAVNTFCNAIDAAGIRDRFYRLNLFCGNSDASLIAVRTPLYRSQVPGGTQFGNTLDTNVNFAITDYAETGASGGLLGDGTSKYLSTGLTPAAMPEIATGHLSAYIPSLAPGSTRALMGAASGSQQFQLTHRLTGGNQVQVRATWGGTSSSDDTFGAGVTTLPGGLWTITRTSSTAITKYNNATSKATGTTSTTPATHTNGWFVHASNSAGTAASFANHRILSYSIGASMTAQQVSDYNAAIQAFQTALSRNV
jgi:hypothetical protein